MTDLTALADLTAPGGPFEVTTEIVREVPLRVYRERHRTLGDLFDSGVERWGDAEHVVFGTERLTFSELADQTHAVAVALRNLGVGHGDRVAVLAANHAAWAPLLWATTRLGAILVGLNGWWKPDEVEYALLDCRPSVLVVDDPRLARIEEVLERTPVGRVVVIDPSSELRTGRVPFDDLLIGGHEPVTTSAAEDDPAVILYTSGTTGRPKGAIWTHRSMIANLQNGAYAAAATAAAAGSAARRSLGRDEQTSLLITTPMFHAAGLQSGLLSAFAGGARAVILSGRFDPAAVIELIETERIAFWGAVPTMVVQVLDHPDLTVRDLSSLRSILYGGSPAPKDLRERLHHALGIRARVGQVYGLTETASVITSISGDDYDRRPASSGRPYPIVELRIVDNQGADVPVGDCGEVLVRGPMLMAGYWEKPDATAEALRDGWLHTGDIGELDAEGFLYLRDRAKDVIIRGGENVYSAEVEGRLCIHPLIAEAAVFGMPDRVLGEVVHAVVRPVLGALLDADTVQQWVRDALADFKVPATIDFTDEPLPRNPTGKLLKNVLRGNGHVSFDVSSDVKVPR